MKLAACDAALKVWPVPTMLQIPSDARDRDGSRGTTRMLLHGYMATSAMWAQNRALISA